ncbi:Mrp/NBP35 family ATP-binding protein [Sphingomicrobium astaxanthinifaciens]|uniref:Mrp/NBP35 family ATP-binding protein n=1 Tax=Sphingomicrobium astaxanthinifaciens TaxID=1227949 RepID=UPI001FCC78BD|nr:Mrp/NBP35 family ATP-binding protein [Sphingomicrobium astaxanthinifaciens]MCJ7421580.1 Mrp/NBP35 family ATP-binding protein [Sphingomicrobium astaxanthinifaciens]
MTDDPLAPLDTHLHADRLKSRRLEGKVARLLVDASGLDALERRALEEDLRSAALALPGVEEVRVGLTAAKVERTFVAIASGKGGVGKSTLSANLAVALARLGHEVGLVDADIYGPSQPRLFGTDEKPKAEGKTLIPVSAHGVRLLSVGQLVEPGTALAWRGPMAAGALNQLLEADWGAAKIILIDLPPGTGDVQLSLISKARPAGALIVSTPQDLALIDATRAIDLFGKTDVPVLGIVENMAGFACPHCGETSDPFGRGGAEASAAELGLPFLGRLPLSASIRVASDAGAPPAAEEGPAQDAFMALARALLEQLGSKRAG